MTGLIEICFAKAADESEIVRFLRKHWRSDHIFVSHPELLRWQHESPDAPGENLTFVFARRVEAEGTSEIIALLGFIPFRRFDPVADWSQLALAIWKVRNDMRKQGLGVRLLKTIEQKLTPSLICAIGINEMVRPIYVSLGYSVGTLSHAALFLEAAPNGETVALGVPDVARRSILEDPGVALLPMVGESLPAELASADIDALAAKSLPRKSWRYILNRYVRHPYYEYVIRAVTVDNRLRAILVWRRVSCARGSILRIVDIIGEGDVLSRCGAALRREVAAAESEYIDLMHWGVSPDALATGGFVSPDDHEELIIPNYFEPFEQRNVRIYIAFWVDPELAKRKLRLFRADSDQDRPNQPESLNGKR